MLDRVIAHLGLIVLSPLIAVLYYISGGFYLSKRVKVCNNGDVEFFDLVKFNTMDNNVKFELSPMIKPESDPRITKAGKFLRKSSLDELPNLLNVASGEMTIFGNRAIPPNEVSYYPEEVLSQKPGIFGIWQTSSNKHDCVLERVAMYKFNSKKLKEGGISYKLFLIYKLFIYVFRLENY